MSFLIASGLVAFGGPAVALAIILIDRLTGPSLTPVSRPQPPGRSRPAPRLPRTELSNG